MRSYTERVNPGRSASNGGRGEGGAERERAGVAACVSAQVYAAEAFCGSMPSFRLCSLPKGWLASNGSGRRHRAAAAGWRRRVLSGAHHRTERLQIWRAPAGWSSPRTPAASGVLNLQAGARCLSPVSKGKLSVGALAQCDTAGISPHPLAPTRCKRSTAARKGLRRDQSSL